MNQTVVFLVRHGHTTLAQSADPSLDNKRIDFSGLPVIIPRSLITSLNPIEQHIIEIELS